MPLVMSAVFSNLWFQKVFTGDIETKKVELLCLHEDIQGVHDLLPLEHMERRHRPSGLVPLLGVPPKCLGPNCRK